MTKRERAAKGIIKALAQLLKPSVPHHRIQRQQDQETPKEEEKSGGTPRFGSEETRQCPTCDHYESRATRTGTYGTGRAHALAHIAHVEHPL